MNKVKSRKAIYNIDVWGSPEYAAKVNEIRKILSTAKRIFTIAHPYSDGDALGSQLALYHWCQAAGKKCVVLNFDPVPEQISWLKGFEELTDILPNETFDLAVLMETTEASRMGEERMALCAHAEIRIHLDHHLDVIGLGDLNILDPHASSTCEILYNILSDMLPPPPIEALEAMYVGIMTDTGNFRFSTTTPRAHEIAARMIEKGLDIAKIFKRVYESNDWRRIVLHGIAMERATCYFDGKLVLSWLTTADFSAIEADETDADGAVTPLTTIAGAEVIVLLREVDEQTIKISFRSTGKVDVQAVSKIFGGGGHRLAAGATCEKSALPKVRERVIETVEKALSHIMKADEESA